MHRTRRTMAIALTLTVLLAASVAVGVRGEGPATTSGSFRPTGWLADARTSHTATLLADGGVLVVGGYLGGRPYASAELWDPATGSFRPTGSLAEARGDHTATLLPDGRVLIVGGDADGTLDSAELWDPDTGSFGPAGSLAEARSDHTATLQPDGRVLVVGGYGLPREAVASAELWDPATGSFSPTGSLAEARAGHTATLLPGGRVLVAGGEVFHSAPEGQLGGSYDPLATAELWDPATGSFSPTGSLAQSREPFTATLLPDGQVLIVGGNAEGALASAELYDPATGSFGPTGSLAAGRHLHTATLLPDGQVLIVGGSADGALASAELYDPATGSFGPTGWLAAGRYSHTATLLLDGRVLVAGGVENGILASAYLWDPEAPDVLDPALAMAELMNMPPVGTMETCQPSSGSGEGLRAVIECSFGDDTVVYVSFDGASSLAAAYDGFTEQPGVEGGTSCQEGPFEGPYLASDGTEAGRVACQASTDGPLMIWTDDQNLVIGFVALRGEGGFAELYDHWLQVRLDAAPADGASSSPVGATAKPGPRRAEITQWAVSAVASSEYAPDISSATEATGSPDTTSYGDDITAWAPAEEDGGLEWMELTYARAVVPTVVSVWESSGAGFVTQVEAWDDAAGAWLTLWEGTDPSPPELAAFSPPLTASDVATQRIRLTIDTSVPGWNEIDAVELVGIAAAP